MPKTYPNSRGEALLTCSECPKSASKIHWNIQPSSDPVPVTVHTFQMRGGIDREGYGMIYQCGVCENLRIWG